MVDLCAGQVQVGVETGKVTGEQKVSQEVTTIIQAIDDKARNFTGGYGDGKDKMGTRDHLNKQVLQHILGTYREGLFYFWVQGSLGTCPLSWPTLVSL